MITRDLALKLQAHVDGQLKAAEAKSMQARLIRDDELSALHDELQAAKTWLREEPLQQPVPVTRDFYWSAIRRGIAASPAEPVRGFIRPGWWWHWLVPAGATALFCLYWFLPFAPAPARNAQLSVGHEIETPLAETTSFSFRSESAAMTVVWVETRGLSNFGLAD